MECDSDFFRGSLAVALIGFQVYLLSFPAAASNELPEASTSSTSGSSLPDQQNTKSKQAETQKQTSNKYLLQDNLPLFIPVGMLATLIVLYRKNVFFCKFRDSKKANASHSTNDKLNEIIVLIKESGFHSTRLSLWTMIIATSVFISEFAFKYFKGLEMPPDQVKTEESLDSNQSQEGKN